MKSLKIVQGLVLVSSLFAASAYAQSSVRGDELLKNPSQYRLGDSNDLQGDELRVEQNKVCNDQSHRQDQQREILNKHLLKYNI